MNQLLLQIGVSNLVLSAMIAAAAFAVHKAGTRPTLAHLLWVLVLVKLVTPPLVTLPVVPVPIAAPAAALGTPSASEPGVLSEATRGLESTPPQRAIDPMLASTGAVLDWRSGVLGVWLLGSFWVLGWSLARIVRFQRLLRASSREADAAIARLASGAAATLGLRATPAVLVTSARISPMVWWAGGRVSIVIPEQLEREMSASEMRWVLAHELAHVKRRDHLVRWLEWLACVAFWWNPIAWLARRNLRISEEICCDALVIDCFRPGPRSYANALMTVVEYLSSPAIRPPAVASEINGGGILERRFSMIVNDHKTARTPRWLQAGLAATTLALLPLGVAYGQDYDAVGKRLREAVANGELSGDQAREMMATLKRSATGEETRERRVTREEYARAAEELHALSEAGRVSEQDAERRLARMRDAMAGEESRGRGASREQIARAAEEIQAMVEAGRISEEDAKRRLGEMHEKKAADELEAARRIRAEYDRAEAALKKAVETGRVSEADATKRLAQVKERIAASSKERDRAREIETIERRVLELQQAVEAGKISRAEAERAVTEIKREVELKRADAWLREAEETFAGAESEIKRAIGSGRITKKEAGVKLEALNRERASRVERGAAADGRAAFARAESEIKRAVESGRMTKEEAYKKLEAIKREMPDSLDRRGEANAREAYARAEAELERGIADGKISIEDAWNRLQEMKRRIESSRQREGRGR